MTLILISQSYKYVLQVTDRLLTYTTNLQPFDKASNKNIIFIASNAVVAIAYTGDAYINTTPTDQWIAQEISGQRLDQGNLHQALSIGRSFYKHDLGMGIIALGKALASQDQQNIKDCMKTISVLITINGYQWDSKFRYRPVGVRIFKRPDNPNTWVVNNLPRDFYYYNKAVISADPLANFNKADREALARSLSKKSPEEAEAIMVAKIREVSKKNPAVGPYVMSILIPPPVISTIKANYHPADYSTILEPKKLDGTQDLYDYSPWIISPKYIVPPQKLTGGDFDLHVGYFTVRLTSSNPHKSNYLFSVESQKRPKRP